MDWLRYEGRVAKRSAADTWHFISERAVVGLVAGVMSASIAIAITYWQNAPLPIVAISAVLAWLGLHVIVVLGNLILAPFRLHRDIQEENGRLSQQIARSQEELRDIREQASHLCALSDLLEDGVVLRNHGWVLTDPGAVDPWWHNVEAWQASVEHAMRLVHPADPTIWRILDKVDPEPGQFCNEQHCAKVSMASKLVSKLQMYINERTLAAIRNQSHL